MQSKQGRCLRLRHVRDDRDHNGRNKRCWENSQNEPPRLKSLSHSVDKKTVGDASPECNSNVEFEELRLNSRHRLKSSIRFLGVLVLALLSGSLLVTFQNCGSMEAAYNPLYDEAPSTGCMGITCNQDIQFVAFKTSVSGVMIDPKQTTSSGSVCDNSTCFDLGGWCETGGFPRSVFYYQWTLSGQATSQPVRTVSTCDSNGRFQVQVKVPFDQFDWTKTHNLRLYMTVVDDNGVEQANPTGQADWSYVVSVRQ